MLTTYFLDFSLVLGESLLKALILIGKELEPLLVASLHALKLHSQTLDSVVEILNDCGKFLVL